MLTVFLVPPCHMLAVLTVKCQVSTEPHLTINFPTSKEEVDAVHAVLVFVVLVMCIIGIVVSVHGIATGSLLGG